MAKQLTAPKIRYREGRRVAVEVIAVHIKTQNQSKIITVEVLESNPVGHLATLLAAADDDGDTLLCDIIEGNINFDFLISRDKGSLIFTKHLNLEWKAGYKFSSLEFHYKVSKNIS